MDTQIKILNAKNEIKELFRSMARVSSQAEAGLLEDIIDQKCKELEKLKKEIGELTAQNSIDKRKKEIILEYLHPHQKEQFIANKLSEQEVAELLRNAIFKPLLWAGFKILPPKEYHFVGHEECFCTESTLKSITPDQFKNLRTIHSLVDVYTEYFGQVVIANKDKKDEKCFYLPIVRLTKYIDNLVLVQCDIEL